MRPDRVANPACALHLPHCAVSFLGTLQSYNHTFHSWIASTPWRQKPSFEMSTASALAIPFPSLPCLAIARPANRFQRTITHVLGT